MSDENLPYRLVQKGLILRLRLTPNGSRDQIEGLLNRGYDNRVVKVRVRAVPEKGKANKAVIKLIAKSIGLAQSKISLASGHKDRNKELLIAEEGEQLMAVKKWLDTLEEIT